jgi:two-component system NtrC family response regulator
MKPSLQSKLLRVLETRQFRRVGGQHDISVDVRVIASTNKNMLHTVESGEFRQDLYYRLKVISVRMPAIRERAEDIPQLAAHFVNQFARDYNKPTKHLSPETVEVLSRYAWPGNVRELRNVIERLVILESEPVILPRHLPPELLAGSPSIRRGLLELPADGVRLVEVERELVIQAMERTAGNQTKAAELLGIERDALRRRLIKYGYLEPTSAT